MIKKILIVIINVFFLMGCKKEDNIELKQNKRTYENKLSSKVDFPSTVYTHKKYKGKITFYNSMLDTIAEPRRDTTNFRFIIYKPFTPYIASEKFMPIYKDSVLLNNNTVDIEFTFDKPGIYNIGGFVRDAIRMNYYSNGIRDSARFIEDELILLYKVVVKDSIF